MLKSPTRPRAPSAATLRILYQLAYISSGTAVGIGALCAEERRRRTQIVQRVADNAKRIRQSPRYAHGATAAAMRQQDFEDSHAWGGNDAENERFQHIEAARERARRLENHEGAKMPELPSVVEEEYGRLIERSYRKVESRSRTGRPDFVEEHGLRESSAKAELDAYSEQRERALLMGPARSRHEGSTMDANPQDIADPSLGFRSYRKPVRFGLTGTGPLVARKKDKTTLFHGTLEGKVYTNANEDFGRIMESFSTQHLWTARNCIDQNAPDNLARDVDVFFGKVYLESFPRLSIQCAHRIADGLLHLAFDVGMVTEIRSLLLWKLAAGVLTTEDIFNTVIIFHRVTLALSSPAVIDFYADLFATSVFLRAPDTQRSKIKLRLFSEALRLDEFENPAGMFEQLAETGHIKLSRRESHTLMVESLEVECKRLVDNDDLPSAVKLWCTMTNAQSYYNRKVDNIFNILFDAALQARHLSLCARMLRIRSKSISTEDTTRRKDAFIRVCFEDGAVGTLQNLFQTGGASRGNDGLSSTSYIYLSRCFAQTNQAVFHKYFRKLSQKDRVLMADASVLDAAWALKANWKASRDLDHARKSYDLSTKRFADKTVCAIPLHVAMVEVELSANQPVEAIKLISELNKGGTDGSIATLTALALAKQKNWVAFESLFNAMRQDPTTWDWTPTMNRAYNNALHLFSRSHTAQQLSDFVSMSINELRFSPNQSTWEILMSALVSKKAIMLLKHWLKSFAMQESKSTLHADIAAAMVRMWYVDFRHSHVLVMWMCRSLAQAAPSLHSDALLNVVRESLGFDLRKLHGHNAPWMGPLVRARQALFRKYDGGLPRPGYVWNGQLYDDGRLVDSEETSVQPSIQYEDVQKYSQGMTFDQIHDEIRIFLRDVTKTTLEFPLMNKHDRKSLNETVSVLNLKYKSFGTGKNRKPILYKTSRTAEYTDATSDYIATAIQKGFLKNSAFKGKKPRGGAVPEILVSAADAQLTRPIYDTSLESVTNTKVPYGGSDQELKDHRVSVTAKRDLHEIRKDPKPHSTTTIAPTQDVQAVTTTTSPASEFISRFEELRPSYEPTLSSHTLEAPFDVPKTETLERQMILQLSLRRYESVLDIYRASLDGAGLPASPMVLEIAVEASIRISDDRQEAENIISAARESGMNVTCAMGPLIIYQMHHTPLLDTQSAGNLRSSVMEYYRTNEMNGLHVKHHVATKAAHVMIQAGFAQHGINLLKTVLQSSWSLEKPLDITTMSVWLSGYAAFGHVRGMHWVVKEVLDQGMTIDQGFLRVLKRARRPVQHLNHGDPVYGKQEPKTLVYLMQWYRVCSRRRLAQMQESKVFGRKLVNLMVTMANSRRRRTTSHCGRRRDKLRPLVRERGVQIQTRRSQDND